LNFFLKPVICSLLTIFPNLIINIPLTLFWFFTKIHQMRKRAKINLFYELNLIILVGLILPILFHVGLDDILSLNTTAQSRFILHSAITILLLIITGLSLYHFGFGFSVSKLNKIIPFIAVAKTLLTIGLEPEQTYVPILDISTSVILIALLIFTIWKTIVLIKKGIIEVK
jgi:hypothetical protein